MHTTPQAMEEEEGKQKPRQGGSNKLHGRNMGKASRASKSEVGGTNDAAADPRVKPTSVIAPGRRMEGKEQPWVVS